jgi:hypothetical protein
MELRPREVGLFLDVDGTLPDFAPIAMWSRFIADDAMGRAGFGAALVRGGLAYSVGRELPGLSGCFSAPAAVRTWLARLGR